MSALSSSSYTATNKLSVLGNLACGLSTSEVNSLNASTFM